MTQLEVLNPVAQVVKYKVPPAARLPEVRGKTLGLYWNMKAGGDIALERAGQLFAQRFEGSRVKLFVGSMGGALRHATPEDSDRIARECDLIVGTTGD